MQEKDPAVLHTNFFALFLANDVFGHGHTKVIPKRPG